MCVGPIPRSKVLEYLRDELDLVGDALDRAYAIIRRVDDEYLQLSNAAATRKPDKNEPTNKVEVTDVEGTKNLLRRAADRSASTKRRK